MIGWRGHTRGEAGYTLVELIVVLAIIGVLLGLASFSFHGWQVKSNVEAQVRQMVTDISELRVRAMTMKKRHLITINPGNYAFQCYTSDNYDSTILTNIPGGTHNVSYQLKKNATTYYSGETYEIDQRGMLVGAKATVFVDYAGSANMDCLSINTVRVNPGKMDATGAICNDQ